MPPLPLRHLVSHVHLLAAVTAACLAWPALGQPQATTTAPSSVVTTPQVRAELVAHAPEGLGPGKAISLGLRLVHKPQWHTYWKNPGDSGLATSLEWSLPVGVKVGDIDWPTPHRLPIGPLMNYGFEGTLLLPVAVTLPAGFTARTLDVKLHAEWLVCKEVCIPESGDFALQVPAQAATAANAADFERARQLAPTPLPRGQATATLVENSLRLRVAGLPSAWQGKNLQLFAETPGVLSNAAPGTGTWTGSDWSISLPLDPQRSAGPAELPVVLRAEGVDAGLAVAVKVNSAWPAVAAAAAQPLPALGNAEPTANPGATATPASALPLGLALLLALLGGALLNLMPCVFPVLSLKVMGFAKHAEDRRELLAGGLAYTAGVVLSFVALASLLLALRAGGEQLGWGFQLQSPAVVAALAALFTLIGLNLAGVFELGSVLPSAMMTARARHPLIDSALTGVLAVAVASPCTAPFMGASLGLAVTLPAVQALTVFAALGLGMALPYLAASAWPALARALPRPGVWMAHFKTVMAFPMFATVVWLVWVLGQQTGIDGAAALLGLLVALAFAAWALGSPALGPKARGGFSAVAAVLLVLALVWGVPVLRHEAVASAQSTADAGAQAWQPWSADRVAQARAAGRPVFVDFTAAWCVTCQFNKRSTLASAAVVADFQARGVLLLRADWTRRDPAITAELARFGRNGVPVYLVYTPGAASPRVLSEILSVDEVRAALAGTPG